MSKKQTVSKAKKKLWTLYAKYMKLKYSNDGLTCNCFTCGANLKIGTSNCQLGHWLPKGGYSYHYFTEDNTRPQCYHCNINLSGNSAVFERNLKAEIGEDRVDEIFNTRHLSEKRNIIWYEELIEHYKQKIKDYE